MNLPTPPTVSLAETTPAALERALGQSHDVKEDHRRSAARQCRHRDGPGEEAREWLCAVWCSVGGVWRLMIDALWPSTA